MDRSRFDLHDGIAARNQSEIMRAAARQAGDQREPTIQHHLAQRPESDHTRPRIVRRLKADVLGTGSRVAQKVTSSPQMHRNTFPAAAKQAAFTCNSRSPISFSGSVRCIRQRSWHRGGSNSKRGERRKSNLWTVPMPTQPALMSALVHYMFSTPQSESTRSP